MGTGKTTIGRALAEREGVPFLDLDEAIAAEAGRSIAAIFAEDGEPAFRALESRALARVLADPSPRVVALGGGALLDPQSRRSALDRARVVTLTARPATIEQRTLGSSRPLLTSAPDPRAAIRDLLAARASVYAESHARVPTDGPLPAVLDRVYRAWVDPALVVPLGGRSYPVRFTASPAEVIADTLSALDASQAFLITDETVNRLWGERLAASLEGLGAEPAATVILRPGEQNKRLAAVENMLAALVAAGADRSGVVVALGGGVVSDMAGFAAATLLRGVRWIVVPTTLLAMVDAAIGGKTGVDLGAAKNAVGAFHQPSAVIIAPAHLSTEEARGYRSGLAEVVKTACIGDAPLFDLLERESDAVLARDAATVRALVVRAAAVKVSIVSRDERESGDRALLNFGHTFGHALEAQGGFERLTHGEAVSLGMVAMLRVGAQLGVTPPPVVSRVTRLLGRLGLPADLSKEPVEEALPYLKLDKKRRADRVRVVLLRGIGDAILHDIPLDALTAELCRAAPGPGTLL
jgi:shikimate kinase/3-dehydroquinate synthase